MGLFDRISSTLDGLAGDDAERVAAEEIDLALGFADRGDLATAEERLRAVTQKFPRLGRGFARLIWASSWRAWAVSSPRATPCAGR
jgi:hypothetical protein